MNNNINLYTRLHLDGCDLLHIIGRSMHVDQPLVNPHLELVPSIGTLSTGRLTGSDSKLLGGHTDGSRYLKILLEGIVLEVSADFLDSLDVAGGEGETDAVDDGRGSFLSGDILLGGVGRHDAINVDSKETCGCYNFRLGLL